MTTQQNLLFDIENKHKRKKIKNSFTASTENNKEEFIVGAYKTVIYLFRNKEDCMTGQPAMNQISKRMNKTLIGTNKES
jgi:hypothetical protein